MGTKIKVFIYLFSIGLLTIAAFIIAPLSITTIFIAAAFVINVLLFRDTFTKDK
jgi:hypothetical protein